MFETYTIKDIAKALGLSTSTVSRALNGSYEIGAETKRLVLEYAEKINYRPNPIALSLKEQKSHSIGVVVAEVANNFFSQAINGIESIAYNRGYHVIITQTHESAAREEVNVKHLLSRHVDGLLVSVSSETTDMSPYQYLLGKGLPIVFFDRAGTDIKTNQVTVNNYKAAFEATEHLIQGGFRRIAHLTGSANLPISAERLRGYRDALEKHQVPYTPELTKYCGHGGMIVEEVDQAIRELLALTERPDAIFIAFDRLTTNCVAILKDLGIRIPQDIALAGFTNSDVAQLFDPPLTVIRQPAFQVGQVATEMLISTIESRYPVTEFKTEVLDTVLIPRASSVKI